jgi:hypothetical protein
LLYRPLTPKLNAGPASATDIPKKTPLGAGATYLTGLVTAINRKYPPQVPPEKIVPYGGAQGPKIIKKSPEWGFSRRLWVKTRKTVPKPTLFTKNARKIVVN